VRGWPMGGVQGVQGCPERLLEGPELRVNCVHPGYVRTDLTIHSGFLTPEEGGSRVSAVALLPAGGPTGAFFMDRQQAPFV
jgi:(+)-neomenthol dehydrogenase